MGPRIDPTVPGFLLLRVLWWSLQRNSPGVLGLQQGDPVREELSHQHRGSCCDQERRWLRFQVCRLQPALVVQLQVPDRYVREKVSKKMLKLVFPDPGTPNDDCTPEAPCSIGEGPCDGRDTCNNGLRCGKQNCANFPGNSNEDANCCYDPYRPGNGAS